MELEFERNYRASKKGCRDRHSLAGPTATTATTMATQQTSSRFILLPDDYAAGTNCQKRQKVYDPRESEILAKFYNIPKAELVDFYWACYQTRQENKFGKALKQRLKGVESVYNHPSLSKTQQPTGFDSGNTVRPPSLPISCLCFSFTLHPETELRTPKSIFTSSKENLLSRTSKMATSGDSTLFEDHFTVTNYDQSKYDRVARISAISADSQTALTLDINIELYPMQSGDRFSMLLASTLSLDGNKDDVSKGWRDVGNESTLADMWDYVCHGKIYKFEDADDGQVM